MKHKLYSQKTDNLIMKSPSIVGIKERMRQHLLRNRSDTVEHYIHGELVDFYQLKKGRLAKIVLKGEREAYAFID